MALRDELLRFVDDEISLDPSRAIAGDTDLLVTRLVDSLGVIDIVQWLEDRLELDIDPLDITLGNFRTVDRMISFVERLRDT